MLGIGDGSAARTLSSDAAMPVNQGLTAERAEPLSSLLLETAVHSPAQATGSDSC
jgi:hypothetical protein